MKKILSIIFIGLLFGGNAYAKCISGDCINGQGTKTDADGNKYVGEFKDGKRNGQGTFDSQYGEKYVGEWKDGDEHGQGISTWRDGTEYVGEFKNSFWNGQGTLTRPDKSKHVGEFKDLSKNGQGTTTYPDGTKLVGVWKKNKPNGQVTYVFPDGGKWVGEIVDEDYFNVQGTNIFFDKKNYTGEYKDDKRNGQGTYMFSNKTKYVGEWKDGKYNNQGTYIFLDGTKYVVKWKDGKRHGVATKIHPSGGKYIVEFKDGKVQPKKKHTLNTSELYDWIKNQTERVSANSMILDDRFTDLLEKEIPKNNISLGMSRGEKVPLIDSLLEVLYGAPGELIYSDDRTYMTTDACRYRSCSEKGFVFVNTEEKFTIGLIRHFFIVDEIPKFFIQSVKDWIVNRSFRNTPPNKVRFIGSDNTIKEVENLFK